MKNELEKIIKLCDIDGINSKEQIKKIAEALLEKINKKSKHERELQELIDELIRMENTL